MNAVMKMPRAAIAALTLALLAGCASLAPDYAAPAVELPADTPVAESHAPWWETAGDATLRALIDEALANNTDLAAAAARIEQARAALGVREAAQWPQVDLQAGGSRGRDPSLSPRIAERFSVQLAASFEIDFWGKYRDATAAAREDLIASAASREALRLSLASQVAQTWFGLVAFERRIGLAEAQLDAQRRSVDLLRQRVAAGVAGDFELQQQLAETAGTEVLLHGLRGERARAGNALGLLLGKSPKALATAALPATDPLTTVPIPATLPQGLPSTRLLNRPDVQAAEARLRAANARIGSARAAWFPSLALTAAGGSISTAFASLFDAGTQAFSVAGALLQPVFSAGRIQAGIDAATAARAGAEADYRGTLAGAFRDVLDALAARQAAQAIRTAEATRVGALAETVRIARQRADAGLTSQFELLASERALLAARSNLVDAERAEAAAAVQVWTAIGG